MRNRLVFGTSVILAGIGAAMASADDVLDRTALVGALQKGGLVIYLRHAATEKDYADQTTADPLLCGTQRVLSESGWQQAKAIGQAIVDLNIPVGEVLTSQYCRAWQTADLAFGRYQKTADLNFMPAETYTAEQVAQMKDRVLPILMAAVPTGTNRVVVGHDDPFEAATGLYPEPQGVAYVVRPGSDGVEVLGHIAPDAWPAP